MTGKALNRIMVSCLIFFSFLFGVSSVTQDSYVKTMDLEYEQQIKENNERENAQLLEDLKTSTQNEQSNNKGNTSNNGSNGVLTFENFVDMYQHAENNLNNSTYIHSVGTGSGLLSGKTSVGNVTIKNDRVSVSFERAQTDKQKYLYFNVNGRLLDGMFDLNYTSEVYAEGALYYLYLNDNSLGWKTTSKTQYDEIYDWDTNQTFQIINNQSVIKSDYFYDKRTNTHSGSAELNVAISSSRANKFMRGVMIATKPAQYLNCKVSVVVDGKGNFRSIKYEESFKIDVYEPYYKVTLYSTISNVEYTETFYRIENGNLTINRPNL